MARARVTTATVEKPGLRFRSRHAKRRSWDRSSRTRPPHVARVSSVTRVTLPKSRRTAYAASSAEAPRSPRRRASSARWKRISASSSSSARRRRRSHFMPPSSGRTHHARDGGDEALPARALGGELLLPGRRQPVVPRALLVLGQPPLGRDPTLLPQAVERR